MDLIIYIISFCIYSFIGYAMYNEMLGNTWHKNYYKIKTKFSERN